jgi:hypothetical protein
LAMTASEGTCTARTAKAATAATNSNLRIALSPYHGTYDSKTIREFFIAFRIANQSPIIDIVVFKRPI